MECNDRAEEKNFQIIKLSFIITTGFDAYVGYDERAK